MLIGRDAGSTQMASTSALLSELSDETRLRSGARTKNPSKQGLALPNAAGFTYRISRTMRKHLTTTRYLCGLGHRNHLSEMPTIQLVRVSGHGCEDRIH